MKAALVTAILHMMGVKSPHPSHCEVHQKRSERAATAILDGIRGEKSKQDPKLIAAVMGKESSWRWYRRDAIIKGDAGELGWLQIKPDGRAAENCKDLDIESTGGNMRCGIRLLDLAKKTCGGTPDHWLGSYNGRSCGPSDYANKVLAILVRSAPTVALVP